MIVGTRRHSGRGRGLAFALVSVLALLSLACLPGLAQATDAPGIEYNEAPPRAEGNGGGGGSNSGSGGGANASKTPQGSGDSGQAGSSGGGSSSKGQNAESNAGGANGGNGQSSPGSGSGGNAKPAPQTTAQTPGASTAQSDGDDGSSPLVPILVAILVLAAISVGAVVLRQRRQRDGGPGSSVSPEAS